MFLKNYLRDSCKKTYNFNFIQRISSNKPLWIIKFVQFVSLSVCQSVSLSVDQSVNLSVCQSVSNFMIWHFQQHNMCTENNNARLYPFLSKRHISIEKPTFALLSLVKCLLVFCHTFSYLCFIPKTASLWSFANFHDLHHISQHHCCNLCTVHLALCTAYCALRNVFL